MTGQEYKAIRIGQSLTQLQLANLLEVDPSTIQRREQADEIPKESELALMRVVVVLEGREAAAASPSSRGS